ncbi:hypothetical protein [Parafrankia sp. CH37]|uniref:hypothetical protein n=1 Tax=Parafrankia sp. CH37 TaxID=683308 RepID=UPI000B85D9EC|nr:hypothetical protein [Parafrankia sp. CH37]
MIAFTVSSCSGDGDTTGRPETAVTSGTASSAPNTLGLWPEDYVLTEGEATTYFTGVPAGTNTAGDQPAKRYTPEFADCLGLSATDLDYEPEATAVGETFVSEDGDSFISSYAEIVTEKQAAGVRAMWASPRFADCTGRETRARIDESGADGDGVEYQVAGVQRPSAPTGAAGYLRVTLQVREQDFTYEMAVDTLVFIVDHVAVTVTYTNYETAPPMDRLQLIADQISGKLARQQPRSIAGRPTGPATSAPRALGLRPEDYVLTEGPATAGFTGAPADADEVSSAELNSAELSNCLGVVAEDLGYEPEAAYDGLNFVSDDDRPLTIESYAEVVTEKQAAADRALLAHPRFEECMVKEVQAEADGPVVDDDGLEYELTGAQIFPAPTGAAGYVRLAVQIRGQGVTVDMARDILLFRVGRVKVNVTYTNLEPAPPMERLQLIADQIAGKLARQEPRSIAGQPTSGGPGLRAAGDAGHSTVLPVAA